MIRPERLPLVLRNVRATRNWSLRDMVNWHRMVRPLRERSADDGSFDFYHLIFDCCTSFEVGYLPRHTRGGAVAGPAFGARRGGDSVVVFVDAPDHTSGVATTLRQWSAGAEERARDLAIFHCGDTDLFRNGLRFSPAGTLQLGVYEGLALHLPCVSDVLAAIRERGCDAIHISTPGPMGLLGLVAAAELGVPAVGTFHTDFPAYAAKLTGDYRLEAAAWRYMRWFYGQFDRIAAPSSSTREKLVWNGIDADRIDVVGRGVRTDAFSPTHRSIELRARWGGARHTWLLYVGRVSREKNLDCLVDAFRLLATRRPDIGLVVTGEGPYLGEMQQALAGLPVVFTGVQKGVELAQTYASSDLFVFPSLTDTFGVVLLEAQASRLPVIISSEGGPKDCVQDGQSGAVVNPMNPANLARAIERAVTDRAALEQMGAAALIQAANHTPARSFEAFWRLHEGAFRRAGRPAGGGTTEPVPTAFGIQAEVA